MFGQGSFINSASATPEEIARKRAEIAAMMPRFGNARYVGEGLGQLFMGIGLGRQQKALDGQEREGRASAQERLNAVFGGGLTGRARPGDFTVLGPSGTFIEAPPPPKPTESFMGKPDTIFEGGNTFGLPAAPAPQPSQPLSFGSSAMTPQEMLIEGAKMRGLDPIDVATAISYETGGTFDPLIQGPTTQWGTHDGLIQFGDPQAVEHGAVFDQGVDRAWQSQLDPKNGAVWSYLESTGVQPGMGLDQIYSAINAGGINRFGASDANNGGAPGTVADKVAGMAPHRENAAKFLGGTWISDPNGAQPVNVNSPQMTAATMPTDALMSLVMDPWQPPEVRAMAQTMLQEQQRMNDPAYTMGLRAQELAIQQAERDLATTETPKPIEVGGVLVDSVTFQPLFDSRQPEAAPRPLTPEERRAWGIPDTDTTPYALGADGMPKAIGGGGVTVNNDMGGGKFDDEFAKGDAATLVAVSDAGLAATRNIGRIDQLDALLSANPTGGGAAFQQAAAEWGIELGEGVSELQAAEAIINSLVPEQRQPGSGPMSDADLALFKRSLPRIINQPGGNRIILDMMRAIAQYDAKGAQIVQDLRAGKIDRATAFQQLQQRENPLAGFKVPARGQGDNPSPDDSGGLSPEERAYLGLE